MDHQDKQEKLYYRDRFINAIHTVACIRVRIFYRNVLRINSTTNHSVVSGINTTDCIKYWFIL